MSNSAIQEAGRRNATLRGLAILLILGIAALTVPSRLSHQLGNPKSSPQTTNTTQPTTPAHAATSKEPSLFAKQAARVNEARSTATQEAIQDGEMLIERPVPEYLMVFRILTNSGINADVSKAQLRPILKRIFTVSECNRMLASDVEKLSNLFADIRNDPDKPNAEKAMLIDSLATNFEQFRIKIRKQRDEHLQELSAILGQLGTNDPEDLLRKVLLAEPVTPPPDPTE
jgi:hypothetical protein